jgi:peptidyl-prolyl cis-trans isomerase-like protein 2
MERGRFAVWKRFCAGAEIIAKRSKMGKKQHQKDKLYLTYTEWSSSYGGYKKKVGEDSEFRRLPFDCCSLSLRNFEDPLASCYAIWVFVLLSIFRYSD